MRALLHRRRGSGDQFSLASFRGIVRRWQTDRQTGCQNSKLAKSWNCLVRGALACSTSSPSSSLLHTGLHCCAVCCVLLCAVCCCRLCWWWCWWESQGRRVERLTTSCLHRHQPDHCHHPRHRLVTVFRSRPKRAKQNRQIKN